MDIALSRTRALVPFCVAVCLLGATASVHAQQGEEVRHDAPSEDATSLVLTAGGVHQAGNNRTLSVNAGADFKLIRGPHGFEANVAWIYSADFAAADDSLVSHNVNARTRYDFFFTKMDGLWALAKLRWDEFAALDPSLQGSVGYARNFIRDQKEDGTITHRFWAEVGYDITSNWYNYDRTELSDGGVVGDENNPESEILHSARLFLAWQRVMNENVSLHASAEALINLGDPNDSRFNFEAGANLKIMDNLQTGLLFRMLVDTDTTGGAKKVDTITQLNLVYTMI